MNKARAGAGALVLAMAMSASPAGAGPSFRRAPINSSESRCASAQPAKKVTVGTPSLPVAGVFARSPLTSASYGYRPSTSCRFFVVDFQMSSGSNGGQATQFRGTPYDLPSSAADGGTTPATEVDCKRLAVEHIIYTRAAGEDKFSVRRHDSGKGGWEPQFSRCTTAAIESFNTLPSAGLIVRVATRVKLRNAFQEAAAEISSPGPS